MWGLVESFSASQQRCCWWGLYGGTTYYWISSFLATESSNKHWEQREDFLANKIVHHRNVESYAFHGTNTTLAKLFIFTRGFKMKIWHILCELTWNILQQLSCLIFEHCIDCRYRYNEYLVITKHINKYAYIADNTMIDLEIENMEITIDVICKWCSVVVCLLMPWWRVIRKPDLLGLGWVIRDEISNKFELFFLGLTSSVYIATDRLQSPASGNLFFSRDNKLVH